MEITTIWSVANTDYEEETGRIIRIHYKVDSTDSAGYHYESYGSVNLHGDLILPIELITEELALKWVYDALGGEVDVINQVHIDAVEKQRETTETSGIPW